MVNFISPDKKFHYDNNEICLNSGNRTSLDFWQWGYSDLVQNVIRGILAEYIVAWVLNLDRIPRNPWEPFDLKTEDGERIEVKSTGYLQSWDYGTKPNPRFVIQERQRWTDSGLETEADFNADIYILCYHKEKNRKYLDPMNLSQWDFWVFSKEGIINLLHGRKSISIAQLERENYKCISVRELAQKINMCIKNLKK